MTAAAPRTRPRPVSLWRRPLLVGICFGLGYGVTQRLLDLRLPGLVSWGQSFDVREFPGTSLDSLRLRHGGADQELRGNLELLELKPETAKDTATPNPTAEAQPEALSPGDVPDAGTGNTGAAAPAPAAPKLPAPAPTQP